MEENNKKIWLNERDREIEQEEEVANVFNEYFPGIAEEMLKKGKRIWEGGNWAFDK